MTDVRTFRAPTMKAALDLVRQELGSEAVILQTRAVPQASWLPWGQSRELVEVTAGLGIPVRPVAQRMARPVQASAAPPASAAAAYAVDATPRASRPTSTNFAQPAALPIAGPVATPSIAPRKSERVQPVAGGSTDQVVAQLTALRQQVEQLQRRVSAAPVDLPRELYALYAQLQATGVDEQVANELLRRTRQVTTPTDWESAERMSRLLCGQIEQRLCCSGTLRIVPGRNLIVSLIGPTGVGKTTTIAKLAANFRLRSGLRVALVTVDTYRIAAVEQLRTYADIIELPMHVVTTPGEMRQALNELRSYDVVLIDTAGRSPRAAAQIRDLAEILAEAQPQETLLVLSAVASTAVLKETIQQFAPVHPTGLIISKLDETSQLGHLLGGLENCAWPITYLTTGQNVPEDIEPAQAARLAQLVLGAESAREWSDAAFVADLTDTLAAGSR